jgi:NTE family protein
MEMRRRLILIGIAILAGCAHYSINAPLTHRADPSTGYRWATTTVPARAENETFVIIALSGGGVRAAALGHYVLREVDTISMPDGSTLLDHVGVISAVSGGSFTAAYYGLHGRAGFDDFERKFLESDVQRVLLSELALSPRNWMRSLSPNFHPRSEVPAEVYDRLLFDNHTFSDLLEQQRARSLPYILVSSTELELGAPFEWTQDQFDVICSDLSHEHVSRAVAASSAVPLLFTPAVLKKYDPSTCGYAVPSWVSNADNAYERPAR